MGQGLIANNSITPFTAQSRRLQQTPQAPRLRYRTGIEQSAEGDEPALCFSSAPSVFPPFPQPLHDFALHGYAKSRYAIKRSPFAGCWCMGSLDVQCPHIVLGRALSAAPVVCVCQCLT